MINEFLKWGGSVDEQSIKTKKGLWALFVVVAAIYFAKLDSIITGMVKVFLSPKYLYLSSFISILLFILVLFLVFFAWLIFSGRIFIFKKVKFPIAISIKTYSSSGRKYLEQTIDELYQLMKEIGLSDQFKLYKVATDMVNSEAEARRYCKKKKFRIFMYGILKEGNEKEDEIFEHCINIAWLCPPPMNRQHEMHRNLDASLFFHNRNWQIKKSTSKADKSNVAENFQEIIMFLLVLSQINFASAIDENIKMLEALYSKIKRSVTPTDLMFSKDKQKVKITPIALRHGRVASLLRELYLHLAGEQILTNTYELAIIYLDHATKIAGDMKPVLTRRAFCFYKLGKIEDALKESRKLEERNPKDPFALVNLAFLNFKKGNIQKSCDYYKKIVATKKFPDGLAMEVLDFLQNEQALEGNNTWFLFSIGILNTCFLDKNLGLKDLRGFLKKTKALSEYSECYELANSICNIGLKRTRKNLNCKYKNAA